MKCRDGSYPANQTNLGGPLFFPPLQPRCRHFLQGELLLGDNDETVTIRADKLPSLHDRIVTGRVITVQPERDKCFTLLIWTNDPGHVRRH